MRNYKKIAIASIAASLVLFGATGCGQNINGNYALTETQSSAMLSATCQSSQANLILTENGQNVTGTASNACFTETLTGTEGSNQLTGVTVTLVQLPQANQVQTGLPQGSSTTCTYTGNLSLQNKLLSGTLALTGQTGGQPVATPSPIPGQQPYQTPYGQNPYGMTTCASSISINGTMSSSN